jgi:lipid-A-disaccharide synthase
MVAKTGKRILIVAGETSADRYGARLVRRIRSLCATESLDFYGAGGDEMKGAGVELIAHVRDLAHIGPREALGHLGKYYGTFQQLVHSCLEDPPAVAVLLDFPEFNLRLAKKMKRAGVKVIYYISPQLWAWRRGRIRTVREYVDKMLVILPFEEAYYRERGVNVEFVGHPLLEEFSPRRDRAPFLRELGLDPEVKTVAVLSGSRRKEVDYILPTLLQAARLMLQRRAVQFLISVAPSIDPDHVRRITARELEGNACSEYFRICVADGRDLLANSDFAFVKSGTSTLEAALIGTPFVIIYKISRISWLVGNFLVHSSLKGLVNLIAREEIVPEFLQEDASPEALAQAALEFLEEPEKAEFMRTRLAVIRKMLSVRRASDSVAATVAAYL